MTRHIIITALCFIATAFTALASAPVERVDTLLFSPKASAIAISRYRTNTTIAVSNVDGSADNFYYQTGSSTRVRSDERSKINYTDITNVLIAETDTKRLLVQFTTDKNHNVEYTYDLPDPDNRYVKTFLGDKSSDFGIQLGVNLGKSGGTRWDLVSGGWGAGWVGTLDCDPSMDASMWKSDEFTWAVVLGVRMTHGPHSLTAGLGIDWRNYVTTGDRYLHKDEEGRIGFLTSSLAHTDIQSSDSCALWHILWGQTQFPVSGWSRAQFQHRWQHQDSVSFRLQRLFHQDPPHTSEAGDSRYDGRDKIQIGGYLRALRSYGSAQEFHRARFQVNLNRYNAGALIHTHSFDIISQ